MNHDFQGPFNETGLKPGSPVSNFRSYFITLWLVSVLGTTSEGLFESK